MKTILFQKSNFQQCKNKLKLAGFRGEAVNVTVEGGGHYALLPYDATVTIFINVQLEKCIIRPFPLLEDDIRVYLGIENPDIIAICQDISRMYDNLEPINYDWE